MRLPRSITNRLIRSITCLTHLLRHRSYRMHACAGVGLLCENSSSAKPSPAHPMLINLIHGGKLNKAVGKHAWHVCGFWVFGGRSSWGRAKCMVKTTTPQCNLAVPPCLRLTSSPSPLAVNLFHSLLIILAPKPFSGSSSLGPTRRSDTCWRATSCGSSSRRTSSARPSRRPSN